MSFPDPFFRWRPHPWHGLEVGPEPPRIVHAYIEITPFDLVKYEIDKVTGYLRVDRPQRTSSQPPTLYGFIPRTYCGRRVHALSPEAERGDGDPLDICVISEGPSTRAEVILNARVVGGLAGHRWRRSRRQDHRRAGERRVLEGRRGYFRRCPTSWSSGCDTTFSTYKMMPGGTSQMVIEKDLRPRVCPAGCGSGDRGL